MSDMKVGIGFSQEKNPEVGLSEAYRKSLQRLQATRADFVLLVFSYDYGLDLASLTEAVRKVLRTVPHVGTSSWAAWSSREGFEGDSGILVMSFKDLSFEPRFFKVNSLKEKAENWAPELSRQLQEIRDHRETSLFVLADSLSFIPGEGFEQLETQFPHWQIFGMGASFSVPQVCLVLNGDVYMNALVAVAMQGQIPWIAISQAIRPELEAVTINRMSENLLIEIDSKPAFYRLCEHLMNQDDLPMMGQDEFRKHMGHMFLVERPKEAKPKNQILGESYRSISLLGSEMTTGMVAVATGINFSRAHYLGQRKAQYAEDELEAMLLQLKEKVPNPVCLWVLSSSSRRRDRERSESDAEIIRGVFPHAPTIGIYTNGEYVREPNQFAIMIIAF